MDSNETFPVKEVLTVAAPFIKGIVDTFVAPKLEKFKQKISLTNKRYLIPTQDHFQEYFYRTYKRLSTVNTLVFNNSQKLLKEIYIPLTLRTRQNNEKERKYKIEGYPSTITKNYQKVLITDTAGMGKSTLMKRIFLDIIDKRIGIPILIELRRLTKEKKILDEIHEQLNAVNKEFNKDLLLELIIDGEFVFILDGYDEISLSDREDVTQDLQNFVSKANINYFFLTSRPEGALKSFGDFQEFTIEPLKKKEAFELLRRYDNHGSVSLLLTKKLSEFEMSNVEEFLTNPLLVSLLFTAFEHKQVIPFKKHIFYRQVYDANFESHDLTKGDSYMHEKLSGLDIDDFHRVLRFMGFRCLKLQKIEFSKDELLQIITEAQDFCTGLKFRSSDFLKDLLINVPLFSQDGIYYRWSHKSLQEYFAAQFIYLDAKSKQRTILERIYISADLSRFSNILDLYYDIDFKTFRNLFISNIVNEYEVHDLDNYNHVYAGVSDSEIKRRKELTFLSYPLFYRVKSHSPFLINDIKKAFKEVKNIPIDFIDHESLGQISWDEGGTSQPNIRFFIGTYRSQKLEILRILFRKKNTLVKLDNIVRESHKALSANLQLIETFTQNNNFELLTDNPDKPFNFRENFSKINDIIIDINLSLRIDHEEAIKIRHEIEIDLGKEKSSDFLIDGI